MQAKDALGQWGERAAADHLAAAGLVVLERNWRCSEGELDILAADGPTLVVCEVKTRATARFGVPSEAVTWRKAQRIRRLTARWLDGQARHWPEIRFDVLSVLPGPDGRAEVQHLRGAF